MQAFHLIMFGCFLLSSYLSMKGDINVKGHETNSAVIVVDNQEEQSVEGGDDDATIETEYDEEDLEIFEPSAQWQRIKTDQAIPAGLHIRMNLETGIKEAKLMDGDDGESYRKNKIEDSKDDLNRHGMLNEEQPYFSQAELKNALKNFKANMDDVKDKEKAEEIREKFRSMDELRKDMEILEMNVESDAEIMQKLLKAYNHSDASVETRLGALHDLEYYVHQIDNANDLVSMGGFHLVLQALNDTEVTIRKEAAFVLGSAVQSNPPVQVVAIDGGAMQSLLRLISPIESIPVRKKAMYAMSSLLRHFPYAQLKFMQLGGLSALSTLFKESDSAAVSLKVKAVTLLHDMLLEQKLMSESIPPTDETGKERLRQYELVELLPAMLNQGWCDLIAGLLDAPDHDAIEKILLTMQLILESCQGHYRSTQVVDRLSNLKTEYERFATEERLEEDGDSYFEGIFQLVGDIMTHLQIQS